MPLPHTTTTITVLRQAAGDEYAEPYEPEAARTVVASGVRAVIDAWTGGAPVGEEQVRGGQQTTINLRLMADPCDMRHTDLVRDDATGQVYRVAFVLSFRGTPGFEHIQAGINQVEGLA